MGFFSEIIASEARQGMDRGHHPTPGQPMAAPSAASKPEADPPATAPETPIARPAPMAEAPAPPAAEPAPKPAAIPAGTPAEPESKQEPVAAPDPPEQQPDPPSIDLTANADAQDEAERKRAHEAAEAKRKAEFDAKQAKKKAARQEQLDRIKAMNDAELLEAATGRVAADTEKLTRRNMKEAVSEHIQAKCREDAAFARLVMSPEKSMINCFKYINRQARAFAEQEMKDLGIERTGTYGCDVPDGLCYGWAEDYFNDPNAKEDHEDEEKFVSKPYVSSTRKTPKAKAAKKKPEQKPAEKSKAPEKPKAPELEQMTLM